MSIRPVGLVIIWQSLTINHVIVKNLGYSPPVGLVQVSKKIAFLAIFLLMVAAHFGPGPLRTQDRNGNANYLFSTTSIPYQTHSHFYVLNRYHELSNTYFICFYYITCFKTLSFWIFRTNSAGWRFI